ncbi:hypothetical protein F7725_007449 [Dissostichus mawsoni]|uniref:HAT C-terminal dimerisation domain-containing protein n=1 Tax=Dissostichus mawsoni TaxID=36200 RepID=A0A7J5XYI6_DISMA|nr:hypothetical protein F7725_007449 [Dissostichus mawsoni]
MVWVEVLLLGRQPSARDRRDPLVVLSVQLASLFGSRLMACGAQQLGRQPSGRWKRRRDPDTESLPGVPDESPKRTEVLDQLVAHRLPRASTTRWNFHSRAVNTVYEQKDDLLKEDSVNFDPVTVREVRGFVRMLEDEAFCFFPGIIMPHVDMLFNQLHKRNIDPVFIKALLQKFTDSMQTIRASISSLSADSASDQPQEPIKRRRTLGAGEQQRLATEVSCDLYHPDARQGRFSFTQHFISMESCSNNSVKFPDAALGTTVQAYPMLNKAKLKTELSLIYDNSEFKAWSGAVSLYQFFMEKNLQSTFTETLSLLRILITTPMTTAESERCFSTLKRIKTFLRNTMSQDLLNALAMLSMEKKLGRTNTLRPLTISFPRKHYRCARGPALHEGIALLCRDCRPGEENLKRA